QLPHICCLIRCPVGSNEAITFDEFPTGAGLPGSMTTKLRVIVTACCAFKGKIADLLQPGQIDAGITLIISILNITCTRRRSLFLPVDTRTNTTVTNDDIVCPLDGVLLHLIERRRRIITTIMGIVVVIFAMAIAGNEL